MSIQDGAETLTMRGALFEAFRQRERSGVIVNAAIGFVMVLLATFALFGFAMWRPLSEVAVWYGDLLRALPDMSETAPPPDEIISPPMGLFALIPAYLGFMFVVCVTIAAFEAACLRWMIRGEADGPFFGLSLGADTWRVYLGYWIWTACYVGFSYALQIGAVLIGILAGVIGGAVGGENAGVVIGLVVGVLAAIVGLCAASWAAIRLAPAAATSIALRRFAFFEGWRMSRGRFWPMTGAFFVAIVVYIAIVLVVELSMVGIVVGRFQPPLPTSVQPYLDVLSKPAVWAPLAGLYCIILAAGTLFYITMFGINARVVMAARAADARAVG